MNRERRYTALIGLMLGFLIASLLTLMGGCTTYTIQRGQPGCAECTTVKVVSWREFEQPVVHYERDGDSAAFDFGAASARSSVDLNQVIGLLQAVAAGQIPIAAPTGD